MQVDKESLESLESLFVAANPDPASDLKLDWILIAVDRRGEGLILDASPDFYSVDLITELYACDNGITVPKGINPGLYLMQDIIVIGGEDDCDIKGSWTTLYARGAA